jgi:hypothetical protein
MFFNFCVQKRLDQTPGFVKMTDRVGTITVSVFSSCAICDPAPYYDGDTNDLGRASLSLHAVKCQLSELTNPGHNHRLVNWPEIDAGLRCQTLCFNYLFYFFSFSRCPLALRFFFKK